MINLSALAFPQNLPLRGRWLPLWLIIIAVLTSVMIALLPFRTAAFVLIGLTLIVLVLIQPLIGIALVLLAGPLGAVESLQFSSSLPKSAQLLFLFTITIWLAHGVTRRRIFIARTPLNLPLVIFIGVGALSLLGADSLNFGLKELIKWVELMVIMLVVTDLTAWRRPRTQPHENARPDRNINPLWILAILLLAAVSQGIIGIWQFGLRGDGPDHFMILDRFYRAFGTFQQPNPFGGFMGISAALAIGGFVGLLLKLISKIKLGDQLRLNEFGWLFFLGVSVVVTSLGLIMSWSRGAWFGFAAGMLVFVFFLPRKRKYGVLLVMLGLLFLLVAIQFGLLPASISERLAGFGDEVQIQDVRGVFVTTENFAIIERLAHWQAGIEMARVHLFSGVGFGNYEPAYHEFGLLNWPHPLGHAHNYYLNILAETGIIGLLLYLILWGTILIQAIRLLSRLEWIQRGMVLGLLAAWTALSVHHFFDKLYVNNLYLYFGVMLALQQVIQINNDQHNL